MKKQLLFWSFIVLFYSGYCQNTVTLTKERLRDKIKGGWAGQTIGVTFGGPYEFRYNGTFIQDYQPLLWYDGYLKKTMIETPGLYDDLYMDLTFVDIIEKYGIDAPVDSFSNAFAKAGYFLWHANQAARYNILNGINAPQSGFWKNNPHSDDIDYQIESDFAGLMSPGMPNAASGISDKVGHIMNYGDGWYGGVFVGAMYSLAFVHNDLNVIISSALRTIPKQSAFYKCISDVIGWHKKYPSDWHQTWFEIQKKWTQDKACGEGIFQPFNIDAKVNAAYVVMGLLYGGGDFTKTLQICTRAGQDADCNPSSAGGILGTILGYQNIPDFWKMGLKESEEIDFKYTTISLNKVYELGYKHALMNIQRNGGRVENDKIIIGLQAPQAVRFEEGFPGIFPERTVALRSTISDSVKFEFEGTGFLLNGTAQKENDDTADYVFDAEMFIDGQKIETAKLPTSFITRRHELFWRYELPFAKHTVQIRVLNPLPGFHLRTSSYVVFSDKPAATSLQAK